MNAKPQRTPPASALELDPLRAITDELIRDEGLELSAYRDSLGYLTIGVGRMIDSRLNGGLTREEAIYLLHNDIGRTMALLDRRIPWWRKLSIPRQRVLVNMGFNLGEKLFEFREALAAMERGEFETAAAEMLSSRWAGQVGDRAVRLAATMRTGDNGGGR